MTDRRNVAAVLVDAWRGFWFKPQSMFALGIVRIAFGALVMAWTLALLPGLTDYFGPNGVAPQPLLDQYRWTIFALWPTDTALIVGWMVLLVSSIALTIGWHSRCAAIVTYVLILSFEFRNAWVFNSGDALIRVEALFLALSPSGAALSLDQRRRTGAFWTAQMRAPWALRLLQIQLTLIYLSSVRAKLSGQSWMDGTAVSYALRLDDMLIIPTPEWLTSNAMLINVATWSTLGLELAIGVLVWNRTLRPWLLFAGVLMHTTIALTINVGFFSPAMFVLYLAFASPETVRTLPRAIRRPLMSCADSEDQLMTAHVELVRRRDYGI